MAARCPYKVIVIGALRQMAKKWDVERDLISKSANKARSEKAKERPRKPDGTLASGATSSGTTGPKKRSDDTKAASLGVDRGAAKKWDVERDLISKSANKARSEKQKGIPKAQKKAERGATSSGTTLPKKRSDDTKAASLGVDRGAVQRAEKIRKMSKQLNRPDILDGIKAGTIKAHSGLKQLEEQKKKNDLQRPVTVALPYGLIRGDFRKLIKFRLAECDRLLKSQHAFLIPYAPWGGGHAQGKIVH